jgi:hypothetical protein
MAGSIVVGDVDSRGVGVVGCLGRGQILGLCRWVKVHAKTMRESCAGCRWCASAASVAATRLGSVSQPKPFTPDGRFTSLSDVKRHKGLRSSSSRSSSHFDHASPARWVSNIYCILPRLINPVCTSCTYPNIMISLTLLILFSQV